MPPAPTRARFETQKLSVRTFSNPTGVRADGWSELCRKQLPPSSLIWVQSPPRRARSLCLQRRFRMHSTIGPHQPVRRLRRFHASARATCKCCRWRSPGQPIAALYEESSPPILSGVMLLPSPSQRFMNTSIRRAFCMPFCFPQPGASRKIEQPADPTCGPPIPEYVLKPELKLATGLNQ